MCPNISCTLFTSAPLLNSNVAQLCLKSCGDISGRPFERIKRFTLCVTAAGSLGAKILFSPGKIKLSSRIVFGCSAMRCALSAFNSFSVLLISGIVRRLADVFGGAYRYPALCCVFSIFRCNASHGSQRTIQAWTIGKSCDPPKEQRSLNKSTALSGGAFVMLSVSHVRNFVRKFVC